MNYYLGEVSSALQCLERNPQLSLATRGEDGASQGQPKGEKPICRSGSNSWNWTWNNRLVPNRDNVGDLCLIPGLGRSPGGGHGNPLQYCCLENPYGQRSLVGPCPWVSYRAHLVPRPPAPWPLSAACGGSCQLFGIPNRSWPR